MMTTTPLTRAMLFVEELRKVDREMPAQHALVLLLVCRESGISQTEAQNRLGLTKSAVQRIFPRLSEAGDDGKPGHGLIEVRASSADARARQAYVTPKGRRVIQSLLHYMEG